MKRDKPPGSDGQTVDQYAGYLEPKLQGFAKQSVFPRLGIEKAAHGIEFSEMQSENVHG